MFGHNHHGNTARLQGILNGIGDLSGHPPLNLKAFGKHVDDARELADTNNTPFRQVGDMRLANDRPDVVLAMRNEGDITKHDHHIVAVSFLKSSFQVFCRSDCEAEKQLLERFDDTYRRT